MKNTENTKNTNVILCLVFGALAFVAGMVFNAWALCAILAVGALILAVWERVKSDLAMYREIKKTHAQLREELIEAQMRAFSNLSGADGELKARVAELFVDGAYHLGQPQSSDRNLYSRGYALAWIKDGLELVAEARQLADEDDLNTETLTTVSKVLDEVVRLGRELAEAQADLSHNYDQACRQLLQSAQNPYAEGYDAALHAVIDAAFAQADERQGSDEEKLNGVMATATNASPQLRDQQLQLFTQLREKQGSLQSQFAQDCLAQRAVIDSAFAAQIAKELGAEVPGFAAARTHRTF